MEVSGPGVSTRPGHEQSPDEGEPVHKCQQCAESGLTVDATGFCSDCKDYICSNCIKQHSTFRGTRGHKIQEGADMPHEMPHGQQCPQHPIKALELYCPSHDAVLCVLCLASGHEPCSNIQPISEPAKNFDTSDEMKQTENVSQGHKTLTDKYRKEIQKCRKDNAEYHEKSLKDFQTFRSKIESMLDKLGKTVSSKTGKLKERNSKKLDSLTEQIDSLEQEMEALMSDIEEKQKMREAIQLFIGVKRNREQMENVANKLDHLKSKIQIKKYIFEADSALKQFTEDKRNMGAVKVDKATVRDLTAKSPDDNKDCKINDMCEISPSELVVTDYFNECMKKIDVNRNTILQKLSLGSSPCDLAVLHDSRVAVTLPDQQQVQIVSTDKGLVPYHTIVVDGLCLGIVAMGDRLIVSFWRPGKVQILDTSGAIYQSFTTDPSGSPLFDVPLYLCLSPDHSSIYISDRHKNTVTCMSTDGAVIWIYADRELMWPLGIATGQDGSLYVCSRDSHSIHVLSADGVRQSIIPSEKFKLKQPHAVCFNKSHDVMYISSQNTESAQCNVIKQHSLYAYM